MRARISHWPSPIYVPSRKSWRDPEDEKHSPVTMQRDEEISGNITVRRLTQLPITGGATSLSQLLFADLILRR